MTTTIACLLVGLGLVLDALNVIWSYRSARKNEFKSGIILIPVILYVAGVLLIVPWTPVWMPIMWVFIVTVFHIICYTILPALFDRLRK